LGRIEIEELGDVRGDDELVEACPRELPDEMADRREPWEKSPNVHMM
jgi:hypothetical protein